jgi:hypothetical protein
MTRPAKALLGLCGALVLLGVLCAYLWTSTSSLQLGYERIQKGMTVDEVVGLMGPQDYRESWRPSGTQTAEVWLYVWDQGDREALVLVSPSNGKVIHKTLVEKPGWFQRLQNWLNWW